MMNLRVPLLLALSLLAAACSTRSDSDASATSSGAAARAPSLGAAPGMVTAQPPLAHRFAGLPDRGALVRYPAQPAVRRDGAYTWHRADLSEAHARAAVGGTLMMTSPSGELLRFRYSRHVEHANGDWTWVGSSAEDPSREAIVTFGDKAAFGSIGQPGKEPLRLTIANGTSWLVETDPRQIAGIVNAATRPTKPDFFVAPEVAEAVARRKAASGPSMQSIGASTSAATTASGTTVDVVIGYTNGFVAGLGGDSQAQTRLNFLVDVTNEAYVNSQVNANVRLVKTVLVNYPDATSNSTALEELTGFKAPSTPTTPNAAFSALRAARDQYGADLVSLVRKFNDPENDGCGIAWLIGGGRSGIDQGDEFFGYSVVSDGRDTGTDGKTYFCRDETFAHELGHNMGSAHDRDTADGDDNILQSKEYGIYDYSFGYKTGAGNGNFYTVMAYGDSGQTRYRVFSNPRTTYCGGSACGIANQADNARSLSQTIPLVSAFRASTVPVGKKNDFDGDGRADIYWRNEANGFTSLWTMSGTAVMSVILVHRETDAAWQVAGAGDFNADGYSDILWRHADTGQLYLHLMKGAVVLPESGPAGVVADRTWTLAALGDFNGDRQKDLYWRNTSTGLCAVWLMAGSSVKSISYVHLEPDQTWSVAGAGDFDGDGKADIIWRNISTGQNYIHYMDGARVQAASRAIDTIPSQWSLAAVDDFNGDGRSDLYWRNSSTGANRLWSVNGVPFAKDYVFTEPDLRWQIVSSGDYNGDGRADIFWRNLATGQNYIHFMSGPQVLYGSTATTPVEDLGWRVVSR